MNLIVNASFEDWEDPSEANNLPLGWTDCTYEPGIGLEAVPDGCPGGGESVVPSRASDGLRYARGFWGEGVAQTVPTVPGQTYVVGFDHAASENCWGGTPFSEWEVLIDGVPLDRSPSDVGLDWTRFETTFEASGSEATVCIRVGHGDTAASFAASIDNAWVGAA